MSDASLAFRVLQRARGRRTLQLFADRVRSQWLDGDEVERRQLRSLRDLVDHAATHVPYYRRLLAERGVDPKELDSLASYSRLVPTLEKHVLQRESVALRADDRDRHLVVHRTGGSSGQPVELPRDRLSIASYWADFMLTRSWWGVTMGQPTAKIWGHRRPHLSELQGIAEGAKEAVKRAILDVTLLSAYEMSATTMRRFARAVRRKRPTSIYGYVSALTTFAKFLADRGLELDLPASAVIIATSEPLYDEARSHLRSVFGRPVANEYGCAEVGLIAFDCPAGRQHVLEESNVVEVVDDAGRSSLVGEGEVIVTPLFGFSVPLLRYKLGDVARITNAPCPCGRAGRIVESIDGRRWTVLVGQRGELIYPQIVTLLVLEHAPQVERFKAVQDRLDHVSIALASSVPIAGGAKAAIASELARRIGPGTRVDVEVVARIEPEPSGKHIPVKSLLVDT